MSDAVARVPVGRHLRPPFALPYKRELHPHLGLGDLRAAALLFWRDNAPGMAGMIAFFGFLSAVPLAILMLAFLGNVLGNLFAPHDVQRFFHSVMPGLSRAQFLQTYWYPIRHSHVATTVLGVISLLFGTLGLHDAVDWAVNRIWHVAGSRPFWLGKLRGLGVIVWVSLFVILSLTLTAGWAIVLALLHLPTPIAAVIALAPAAVLDVAIFTALYMLTPMTSVRLGDALGGAVVAALLWGASKLIFGWWVLQVGTYDRVYGPLAASVIVMLWLWISAMIFLFGAAITAASGRPPAPPLRVPRIPV